jgi:hypothetical protein
MYVCMCVCINVCIVFDAPKVAHVLPPHFYATSHDRVHAHVAIIVVVVVVVVVVKAAITMRCDAIDREH